MAESKETLQLAAEERAKPGIHDLEVSFGGELELQQHFDTCLKNPGHVDFIPVNKFSLLHLPVEHRTIDNYFFACYLAELTVKVSVRYVSPHRPPGYVLSEHGGKKLLTAGSGYLYSILGDKSNSQIPCPIRNCPKHAGPHDVFGYFSILTGAHVVFDDLEAGNTSVEFFYDDPVDKTRLKVAEGVKVGTKSVEGDFLELLCVTHDKSLFDYITLLHTGSDLTFMPRLRMLTTRLLPHLPKWPLETKWNIMLQSLEELGGIGELGEVENELNVRRILLIIFYSLMDCFYKSYETVLSELDCIESFIKFFKSDKRASRSRVDILMDYHIKLWPDITVAVIGMDEVKETVIILKKIEILFQRRRCHMLLDENMQMELSSLFRLLNSFIEREGYVINVTNESQNQNALPPRDEEKPLIITISHPHGQSKQMTFGSFITCDTSSGYYKHIYNNPTCNGGSGAPVWVIPSESKQSTEEVYGILHRGHHGNELNEGSAWTFYLPFGDRSHVLKQAEKIIIGKVVLQVIWKIFDKLHLIT